RSARNNPSAELLAIVVTALIAAAIGIWRIKARKLDWRKIAAIIEARFPELDGRLLTAVQQVPGKDGTYNLLQERLLEQTLQHAAKRDWNEAIPRSRLQ